MAVSVDNRIANRIRMSPHFSHLFGVPYLLVTVMYRNTDKQSFRRFCAVPWGHLPAPHKHTTPPICMHIGVATLIAQREGNVSPLMLENIKEEEMGEEHSVNKEIKLSGERRKRGGDCI